jgi:hypothetical protein
MAEGEELGSNLLQFSPCIGCFDLQQLRATVDTLALSGRIEERTRHSLRSAQPRVSSLHDQPHGRRPLAASLTFLARIFRTGHDATGMPASPRLGGRRLRREAEEASSQARVANAKLLKLSNAPVSPAASAMASANLPAERTSSGWTGAYWGASAGGAATRSSVHSSQRDLQAFPGNTPPFNVTGYDVVGQASAGNGGGAIDVFAGWNVRLSNFVVGGQLEATAGALNFNSSGSKAYTYFDANGPTGSTANGDFRRK